MLMEQESDRNGTRRGRHSILSVFIAKRQQDPVPHRLVLPNGPLPALRTPPSRSSLFFAPEPQPTLHQGRMPGRSGGRGSAGETEKRAEDERVQ